MAKSKDNLKEWVVIVALVLGVLLMWLFPNALRIRKVGSLPEQRSAR